LACSTAAPLTRIGDDAANPMAPRDLYDLCSEYLNACGLAVEATVGGAIERAFVSAGPPVIDCIPQLSVHPGAASEGDTAPLSPPLQAGHRDRQGGAVHLVSMTCLVIRCAATTEDNSPPELADLERAARETAEDLWAIWNLVRAHHRDGTLFSSPSGSRELFLDPAFPLPPGGLAVGWQIPIRVALGGYTPS
jgi:hypothetical protein